MEKLKGLVKSKTFWFNIASAGLELSGLLTPYIPPGSATLAVNMVNIGLRVITKTALEDKV